MSWHTPIAPLAGQLITDVFWSQQITENINVLKTPFTDLGILKWPAQAFTTTGTVNDLVVTSSVIRCTNGGPAIITGFSGGVDGQLLLVENAGGSQVDLPDQATAGSVATNRVINPITGTISLATNGRALLRYDGTSTRWRTLFHEQGAPIPFTSTWGSSGSAPALGNGTLSANFYLRGRLVTYDIKQVMGSTTTYGSGGYSWTLPFTTSGGILISNTSGFSCQDVSAGGAVYAAMASTGVFNVNAVNPYLVAAAGSVTSVSATVPFTFAVGDLIYISGSYYTN